MADRETYLPDGKTPRCPAVGLSGQCSRPYERHGHQDVMHDPTDACYPQRPAHPAAFYNNED